MANNRGPRLDRGSAPAPAEAMISGTNVDKKSAVDIALSTGIPGVRCPDGTVTFVSERPIQGFVPVRLERVEDALVEQGDFSVVCRPDGGPIGPAKSGWLIGEYVRVFAEPAVFEEDGTAVANVAGKEVKVEIERLRRDVAFTAYEVNEATQFRPKLMRVEAKAFRHLQYHEVPEKFLLTCHAAAGKLYLAASFGQADELADNFGQIALAPLPSLKKQEPKVQEPKAQEPKKAELSPQLTRDQKEERRLLQRLRRANKALKKATARNDMTRAKEASGRIGSITAELDELKKRLPPVIETAPEPKRTRGGVDWAVRMANKEFYSARDAYQEASAAGLPTVDQLKAVMDDAEAKVVEAKAIRDAKKKGKTLKEFLSVKPTGTITSWRRQRKQAIADALIAYGAEPAKVGAMKKDELIDLMRLALG